jgi:hypothetical protein
LLQLTQIRARIPAYRQICSFFILGLFSISR